MRSFILVFLLLTFSISTPANAAKIRNLDNKPQSLTVINGGQEQQITIKANELFWSPGPSVIIIKDKQRIRAKNRDEYVIWDNIVYLQHRGSNHSGGRN